MPVKPRPGLWKIFTTWFFMGLQSFGGGASTFILIHEACIKNGWQAEEEFSTNWALSQISPGINLLKLTILITQRLRGWPGLVAGVAGLLLPSAVVTALMTAGFAVIRDQPVVQAAMRGILPATIGLSLAMGVQMGQPLMVKGYREGARRLAVTLLILVGAACLLALANLSPALVLLFAGLAGILLLGLIPTKSPPAQERPE